MGWVLRVVLVAWLLALGACASRPAEPEITPGPVQGGKGVPNGRSEGSAPFVPLSRVAQDPSYGFSPQNPIKVGGAAGRVGSLRQRLYLNALRGPNGEPIDYERKGSCCPFKTPDAEQGTGLLDAYKVAYAGLAQERTLYLSMYESGPLQVPEGFTARRAEPRRPDPRRGMTVMFSAPDGR